MGSHERSSWVTSDILNVPQTRVYQGKNANGTKYGNCDRQYIHFPDRRIRYSSALLSLVCAHVLSTKHEEGSHQQREKPFVKESKIEDSTKCNF